MTRAQRWASRAITIVAFAVLFAALLMVYTAELAMWMTRSLTTHRERNGRTG